MVELCAFHEEYRRKYFLLSFKKSKPLVHRDTKHPTKTKMADRPSTTEASGNNDKWAKRNAIMRKWAKEGREMHEQLAAEKAQRMKELGLEEEHKGQEKSSEEHTGTESQESPKDVDGQL